MKILKMLLTSVLLSIALSPAVHAAALEVDEIKFGKKIKIYSIENKRWLKSSSTKLIPKYTNSASATSFTFYAINSSNNNKSAAGKWGYLVQTSTGRYAAYDSQNPGQVKMITESTIKSSSRYYAAVTIAKVSGDILRLKFQKGGGHFAATSSSTSAGLTLQSAVTSETYFEVHKD